MDAIPGGSVNLQPYLFFGLASLGLSVGIPAILRAVRKHKNRHQRQPIELTLPTTGLTINKAKWYCTVVEDAQRDVTTEIGGMARGHDSLKLRAHNDPWGDVCDLHRKPGQGHVGHTKFLSVDFTYRQTVAIPWDTYRSIPCAEPMANEEPEINLLSVEFVYTPDRKLDYPLKAVAIIRNESPVMLDVRMFEFIPSAVSLKKFVADVIKLKLRDNWYPSGYELDQVAVLPGQLFKAWLGIDEAKFTKSQLETLKGNIGTLVLLINGKTKRAQL